MLNANNATEEIAQLCDLKTDGTLTAEQFFGAVEIVLGRRPRNERLSALLQDIGRGRPVGVLISYLREASG